MHEFVRVFTERISAGILVMCSKLVYNVMSLTKGGVAADRSLPCRRHMTRGSETMLRSITLQSEGQATAGDVADMITQRLEAIRAVAPSVAVVYTSHMEGDLKQLLDTVADFFPQCQIMGCTTDGELSLEAPSCRDTVQVSFIGADACHLVTGAATGYSRRPVEAVQEAYAMAAAKSDQTPRCAVALLDGLACISVDNAAVLAHALGEDFPVVGGTAGDRFLLRETFQFHDRQVLQDAVLLLVFCGPVLFSTHNAHGRRPIGLQAPVSGVDANVVRRIGDMPALDYYASHLGPNSEEYRQFPLMVYPADGSRPYLCSSGFFDESDGSVAFIGAFPGDVSVQLCEADRQQILSAARESCSQALETFPGDSPQLAMLFSCASRRHILGTWAGQETDFLRERAVTPNAFGFYTYGEIGPDNESGAPRFHSDTFITLFLGEDV